LTNNREAPSPAGRSIGSRGFQPPGRGRATNPPGGRTNGIADHRAPSGRCAVGTGCPWAEAHGYLSSALTGEGSGRGEVRGVVGERVNGGRRLARRCWTGTPRPRCKPSRRKCAPAAACGECNAACGHAEIRMTEPGGGTGASPVSGPDSEHRRGACATPVCRAIRAYLAGDVDIMRRSVDRVAHEVDVAPQSVDFQSRGRVPSESARRPQFWFREPPPGSARTVRDSALVPCLNDEPLPRTTSIDFG
jgi:hypothetical protein